MILATGWTATTLRAQPARLVRAIAWRLFVAKAWNPELARAANAEIVREPGASAQAWLDAIKQRDQAKAVLCEVEAELWPEDMTDG